MKKKTLTDKFNDSAVSELHFANMQIADLLDVLHKLERFTDALEGAVIANALTRHELDRLIHAKLLFK